MASKIGKFSCAGGLHMVNITNPTSPGFAGCFAEHGYIHDTQCVVNEGPNASTCTPRTTTQRSRVEPGATIHTSSEEDRHRKQFGSRLVRSSSPRGQRELTGSSFRRPRGAVHSAPLLAAGRVGRRGGGPDLTSRSTLAYARIASTEGASIVHESGVWGCGPGVS